MYYRSFKAYGSQLLLITKSDMGVGGSGHLQSDKHMAATLGEPILQMSLENPTFTRQELHF